MYRLILETSSARASVALFSGNELVAEDSFPGGRGPKSPLFSIIERYFRLVSSLDEIVVGVGPGSYSGIRIGISAAIGMHLGRKIPAMGVHSALGYEGTDYQVVLDARGSWIYTRVVSGAIQTGPLHCAPEELREKLDPATPVFSPDQLERVETTHAFPSATVLGRRLVSAGLTPTLPLRPLYLREPHITLARKSPTSLSEK